MCDKTKPIFEVGKTYRTVLGEDVRITGSSNVNGRPTVNGRPAGSNATRSWFADTGEHLLDDNALRLTPGAITHRCPTCGVQYGHTNDRTTLAANYSVATPKTPIPHADIVDALLKGKTVQMPGHMGEGWVDMRGAAAMRYVLSLPGITYRVKPESVVKWLHVSPARDGLLIVSGSYSDRAGAAANAQARGARKLLRLELDPDTLDVISARTEAP